MVYMEQIEALSCPHPKIYLVAASICHGFTVMKMATTGELVASPMLPPGTIVDERFKGKTTLEIYVELCKLAQEQNKNCNGDSDSEDESEDRDNQGCGSSKGSGGKSSTQVDVSDGKGGTEKAELDFSSAANNTLDEDGPSFDGTPEEAKQRMQDAMCQIANQAKSTGWSVSDAPSHIQQLVDEKINPKLDWQTLLANLLTAKFQSMDGSSLNWASPNKTLLASGYHLPTYLDDRLGNIAVAIDMSGSVSLEETKRHFGAIWELYHKFKPQKLLTMEFTHILGEVKELEFGDELDLSLRDSGGTDIHPVYKYIEDSDFGPEALFVFTDGYLDFPPEPDYPVIWILFNTT